MQPESENDSDSVSEKTYWQPEADNLAQPVADDAPAPDVAATSDVPLSWQASEFIHHEKSGMWFMILLAASAVLLAIDFFLIKSWTFGALIVVMAIGSMVIARRQPRMLNYMMSAQGIQIGEKHFSFHDFRAFGVVQEGAFYSIRLIPNKRFMPMATIYFPPELGEQIVDMFGAVLPMEKIQLDPIDKFVEKIRF